MEEFPVSLDNLINFVRAIKPEGDELDRLSDAIRVSSRVEDQADALIGYFVDQARRAGASWSQIGESMGVSKQAAQKRYVARGSELIPGGPEKMFSRFAPRARNALVVSRQLAAEDDTAVDVEPRHIVGGLLTEPEGIAARAVHQLGISDESVFAVLRLPAIPVSPLTAPATAEDVQDVHSAPFGVEAKKLIARTLDIALHYGHNYIGTEHLILSAASEGPAAEELAALGLGSAQLRPVIESTIEAIVASKN